MKQTHKEAIYLNWSSKRTRAHLATPWRFFLALDLQAAAGAAERSQSFGAGLKGKHHVLQCIGAPSRTFAALSQRESRCRWHHLSLRSNHGSWVDDWDQTWRWTVSSVDSDGGKALTWTQVLPGLIWTCWEILLDAVGRTWAYFWRLALGSFHFVSGIQCVPVAGKCFKGSEQKRRSPWLQKYSMSWQLMFSGSNSAEKFSCAENSSLARSSFSSETHSSSSSSRPSSRGPEGK